MRIDYPRAGRRGAGRFVPSWRLVLGSLVGLMLAGITFLAVLFAVAWAAIDVPEESDVAAAQTSIVYWNDATTEMARLGDTNRISVPLQDVPEHVRNAVLAAEDRTFYSHHGFAAKGFLRALWSNVTGGGTQGGSTITQQYAKNAYLSSDRSYIRKFKELVLSLKLEVQLTKDEILERYLNTIFFGRAAYGIQTASEAYFDTDASDLTLEQGAVLASIINAPALYNPDSNLENLQARYEYVLDGMVEQGWLAVADHEEALDSFPEFAERSTNEKFAGSTGHLLAAIQRELLDLDYSEDEIAGGGLRIVSTFDRRAQRDAVEAVTEAGPTTGTKGLRIGLAAVRPFTGEVVALYGGADYLENSLNNATQAIAQAGSTFKPFALAAATEQGIGLYSLWPGNSPTQVADYEVTNYANSSYGYRVSLLRGTELSINTAYVALSEEISAGRVKDAALRAGIPSDTVGFDGPTDLTFVLGTDSPHTIDVAGAYATFAARGQRATPTMIQRVTTAEGAPLYARGNTAERVFPESVADVVNSALQSVVRNGTGRPAAALGRPVAAKTESTDEYLSAWFAGYVPELSTAVSFSKDGADGNPVSLSGTGGMEQFYGGGYPAAVWEAFMSKALEGEPVIPFVTPTAPPVGGGSGGGGPWRPRPTWNPPPSRTPTPGPTETVAPTPSVTAPPPPATTPLAPTPATSAPPPTPSGVPTTASIGP